MLLHEAVQDELSERAWGQWGTSPSSQMGLFSRHGDFQTLLGGHAGQLRQCFGHAFIYHDPFFSSSVANLKMFNAFRFLVIFKESWSVSVLFFFFFLLDPSPWLYQYLYFFLSLIAKYGLRRGRRLRANMTRRPVLSAFPLLKAWLTWCLQGIRHRSLHTK